jgi:hypothetical protein
MILAACWTAAVLAVTPAAASAVGAVSGTVRDSGSLAALPGITAEAYTYNSSFGTWDWVADAVTGPTGTYSIPGLAAGTYRVGFFDYAVGRYRGTYFHAASSVAAANDVAVTDGSTTPGIDATLTALPLAFSGTVRDASTTVGISNVEVALYDNTSGSWAESLVYAYTRADGTWALYGTPAGTYRFGFRDLSLQHASQFYSGASTVTAGTSRTWNGTTAQTGIDASLAPVPPMLSGSINDTAAAPVAGAEVTAYEFDAFFSAWIPVAWTLSGPDGSWGLGVPDGTYRIGAHDPAGYRLDRFYNDKADVGTADNVAVSGTPVAGVNIAMPEALPSAIGSVVTSAAAPIAGIEVVGWRYDSSVATWVVQASAQTTADGSFVLRGLGDGTAIVSFDDPLGRYGGQYWNGQPNAASANTVFVSSVAVANLGTVTLTDSSPSISGTVKSSVTTSPLAGIDVTCWSFDARLGDYVIARWATTAADGTYTFSGLLDGAYLISFEDPLVGYYTQWYAGASARANATPIVTTTGIPINGVDAALSPIGTTGSIVGTITAMGTGGPLAGKQVTAYEWDSVGGSWQPTLTVLSGASGSYALTGLAAGDYRVGAGDGGTDYHDRYYTTATAVGAGTSVQVVADATNTASIALEPWAHVTGTVTDVGTGVPLSGITVVLYRWVGGVYEVYDFATSGVDGSYAFYQVPLNVYAVEYFDPNGIYARQFYSGRTALDFADPVPAGNTLHATGINARLDMVIPPSISGTVTYGKTGLPFTGATAYLYNKATLSLIATTPVNGLGVYRFAGVPTGTYRVGAAALGYALRFYGGSPSLSSATDVPYTAGSRVSGVDIGLYDVTPPTVSSNAKSSYVESATITLTASEAGGSGFATLSYRVDGGATVTVPATSVTLRFVVGSHSIAFWARDNDGNSSAVKTAPFTVNADLTPPVVTSDAKSSYVESATVAIRATDVGGVGVASVSYRVDGGATVTVSGARATVAVSTLGQHTLSFWAKDLKGNTSSVVRATFFVTPDRVVRIGGANRYAVAAGAAVRYPSGRHVVLACGDDAAAADPLAASGLSWAYGNAPILLVPSASTPPSTKRAIDAICAAAGNGSVTIHIVGGTGSVPDSRIADIRAYVRSRRGAVADRILADRILSTGNRYDMASAIAARMKVVRGSQMATFALVANGENPDTFFDALSLAPISARNGAPILLVRTDGVPSTTRGRLALLGIPGTNTFIAGGPGTITDQVRLRLQVPLQNRLAGPDRYHTAIAVADKAIASGWLRAADVGLSARIPDALAGGALLGRLGGPMLVTTTSPLERDTKWWLSAHRNTITKVWVFGGESSVATATAQEANIVLMP